MKMNNIDHVLCKQYFSLTREKLAFIYSSSNIDILFTWQIFDYFEASKVKHIF